MKTQAELRAFVWGIMTGLVIIVGCFAAISSIEGIKWQPVVAERNR